MQEMTLRELQNYCLEITKEIHNFCVENNIKYSLGYGSLLGAIRHKGFIPWDDDVDLVMPRPDFDKFCRTFKSAKYKLATTEDSYLAFARVYDDKDTFCRTLGPWLRKGQEGCFVDIFSWDAIPDDEKLYIEQKERAKKCLQLQLDNRGARKKLIDNFKVLPFKEACSSFINTLKKRYNNRHNNLDVICGEYQKVLHENEWGTTSDCALLCYAKEYCMFRSPISIFDDLVLADFEDTQLLIFKDYDTVLKKSYGDYMQLPPKEKQEQHALSISRFYWKNK